MEFAYIHGIVLFGGCHLQFARLGYRQAVGKYDTLESFLRGVIYGILRRRCLRLSLDDDVDEVDYVLMRWRGDIKPATVELMEHDMVERRLHASYGWNKRFYMEMVRIGAVPKPPSDDEGTERPRKKSKKSSFDGTEGPSEPRGPPSDS
ncbi:hypothetical protein Tco_1104973 [Tanacetum coccineum]